MWSYIGECPICKREMILEFNDTSDECPNCFHKGYWDEVYSNDNYWLEWIWE